MSNIINSIKLDYYILKSYFWIILAYVFIAILVGSVNSNPPLMMFIISITVANFMSNIFSICEKNKINKLYGFLPIRKQQIIIGRYLFALMFGTLNEVMAAILTLILAHILNINISGIAFIAYLCGSFLVLCLFVSVQFPLYFKYEYSKIIVIAILPLVLLFVIGLVLIKRNAELFSQIIKFFMQNQNMIWLIGIFAGLIILSISCLLSCVIYKNHEL